MVWRGASMAQASGGNGGLPLCCHGVALVYVTRKACIDTNAHTETDTSTRSILIANTQIEIRPNTNTDAIAKQASETNA